MSDPKHEPVDNPMRFFQQNVDCWGPLEWFNRLANAIHDQDKSAVLMFQDPENKDMHEIAFDTCRMIAASSAMHLVREHEASVCTSLSQHVEALTAQLDALKEENERLKAPSPQADVRGDLYDADAFMADGEVPMTAAENVLAWLLIEKIGVPDDVGYSPNQAQEIIGRRLNLARELEEIDAMLAEGQGDDEGHPILPEFTKGITTYAKVEACLHLLERRRDALHPSTVLNVQCERCQGNGEIVTDWERYRHPHEGDVGDEAVAECPDCNGEGEAPPSPQPRAMGTPLNICDKDGGGE